MQSLAPIWIALAGSASLFIAFLGARSLLVGKQRVSQRLQDVRTENPQVSGPQASYMTEAPLPEFWRAISFLGWALPALMTSENVAWDLVQAGYRKRGAPGLYAGAKVLLCALFGSAILLLTSVKHLPQDQIFLLAGCGAFLGYFVPNFWVSYRSARRREDIGLSLPDALDLLVICVEAGQGLNAAILRVGHEIKRHSPFLSEELQILNREVRIGLDRAQALRNFSQRTGVEEARALAAVLIQSDRLGTSVAKALRVHAASLRTRRRQRAEEAARKTAVKLVFPLVLCIFPELLVVILAPAVIQLVRVLADSGPR